MIKLIGTDHLMRSETIERIIKDENPDILGVELCEAREVAIFDETTKETIEKKNSNVPLLSKITEKIREKAKNQNLDYGSDMKTVLRYANNNKIECLLVDMPILKIQELFNILPEEEKQGFQKELQEFESQPLIEQDAEQVLNTLKSRYPIAFEFLVNMRNLYIANQLLKAREKHKDKKVLVFLGKSHIKLVENLLEVKGGNEE